MNWYKIVIAGNREDYLRSIGASEDIIQYITSLDENTAQLLTNEFRKNPQMTVNDIQQLQLPSQHVVPDINKQMEDALISKFPEVMKSWALKQTRKMWRYLQVSGEGNADGYVPFVRSAYMAGNKFGQKLSEITDWVIRSDPVPDISSYSYDQAVEASDEWHKTVAGMGEGKIYEPTQQSSILYGPTWIDKKTGREIKEYKGWTIQNVTSKNDLLTEGNNMSHCVGSYCDDVERGDLSIISLRDTKNNPHVTIELSSDGETIEQIQGNSNQSPANEYKAMIKHWIQNSDNPPKHMGEEDRVSSELSSIFSRYNYGSTPEMFNELVYEDGEYGLSSPWGEYEVEEAYKGIIEHLNKNDRGYGYSGDSGMGEDLVYAAIKLLDEKIDGIELLTDLIQKTEEESNDYIIDMDIGIPYPHEEDFKSTGQYEIAMEEYQKVQDDQLSDMMPFGFINSLYKDISEGLQKYKGMDLNGWWKQKQQAKKETVAV